MLERPSCYVILFILFFMHLFPNSLLWFYWGIRFHSHIHPHYHLTFETMLKHAISINSIRNNGSPSICWLLVFYFLWKSLGITSPQGFLVMVVDFVMQQSLYQCKCGEFSGLKFCFHLSHRCFSLFVTESLGLGSILYGNSLQACSYCL